MSLFKPTRRDLFKMAAAAPALAMPLAARAELGAPEGSNPSHFRFSIGDARVTVHDHALGRRAGALTLSDAENASSAVADHDKGVEARVVSAADFFAGGHFPRVDLVKMNIEGGEYDLLPALIETGVIRRIARLQVQFHLFAERMVPMRDAIRNDLDRTHDCAWCYPFVWEEWRQAGAG